MGAVGAWIPSRPSTAGAFFRSTGNEGPALSNFLTFLKKTRHMGLLIKPPIFKHWQLFFLKYCMSCMVFPVQDSYTDDPKLTYHGHTKPTETTE